MPGKSHTVNYKLPNRGSDRINTEGQFFPELILGNVKLRDVRGCEALTHHYQCKCSTDKSKVQFQQGRACKRVSPEQLQRGGLSHEAWSRQTASSGDAMTALQTASEGV